MRRERVHAHTHSYTRAYAYMYARYSRRGRRNGDHVAEFFPRRKRRASRFSFRHLCRRRDEGGFCFSGWRTRRDNKLLADAGSLSLDFFIFDRAEIEYKIFRDSEPRRGGSRRKIVSHLNSIIILISSRHYSLPTFQTERSNGNTKITTPI